MGCKQSLVRPLLFGFGLALALGAKPVDAGNLQPTAPPAPTMKPLSTVPGSWSRILPAAERWELVMGGAAVLDHETGLVWEKAPDTRPVVHWYDAVRAYEEPGTSISATYAPGCPRRTTGGRRGWRVPSLEELSSLVDASMTSPALPVGHPFVGIRITPTDRYWTSSDWDDASSYAYTVGFATGQSFPNYTAPTGNNAKGGGAPSYCWCVRGPSSTQNRK